MITRARLIAPLAAALLAGCAFVPREYPRLDEVVRQHEGMREDPGIQRTAGRHLMHAQETLESARAARDGLADPAEVDHLAYLARQRLVIARLSASLGAQP